MKKSWVWILILCWFVWVGIMAYLFLIPLVSISSINEQDAQILSESSGTREVYIFRYTSEKNINGMEYFQNSNAWNTDGIEIVPQGTSVSFYISSMDIYREQRRRIS